MASLATESNSFSPIPTGWSGFRESLYTKTASRGEPGLYAVALTTWRNRAEALGWDVAEGLATYAQPAGPTVREVYETIRDDILTDLQAAMPVDVVLLSMHGAMIAQGYDDCEGDMLARVRQIVGPDVAVGLEVDPHCHLTELMLDNATAIICYKEYPHVDISERADELFTICADAVEGKIAPVMRDYDCRMILAMPTPQGAMRGYVDDMMAREGHDGVLSLSLAHSFPWGDHPRVGARALAICDGDAEKARAEAQRLGEALFALRHDLWIDNPEIDAALDMALAEPSGPVVLGDVSDNAGGGAPADATFLLRRILERGITSVATGLFYDPGAVRICREAGEGATLPLRIGGKHGPMSGDPLDLTVTVRKCASDLIQHFGKLPAPVGNAVWVECNGVDIVLNDIRGQTFHPEAFTQLGIDLSQRKIVCVKSSNHYKAGFDPIATRVIPVATPGAITPDYANIPYTKRGRDYWPAQEDPFA